MDNIEIKIMAARLERERLVRDHVKEGHILRTLAERRERSERGSRGGVMRQVWHVANGALRRRWTWSDPRQSRVAVADEFATEVR